MSANYLKKPTLLLTLTNDYAARDFIGSGVLAQLKDSFELWFVIPAKFELDLNPCGRIVGRHSIARWRMMIWETAFGLRHLAGLDPIIQTQEGRLNSFQRGRRRSIKALVFALHRLGLSGVVSRVLERFLAWTARGFLNLKEQPDVALLQTGINDPLWDDTIIYCRRKNIPSLTVTVNWDNIGTKVFLQKPELLGVWGEQGYLFARLLQKIPAEKVINVGTPRFEHYRKGCVTKSEARRRLGLSAEKRIFLFAGAGVAFDEVSLIEEFEAACRDGVLPADLLLVYKPHPRRHKRAAEPLLRTDEYRYVQVLQEIGLTPLEDYPVLLSAMDGLVSPFSTMLLEGALMGLPALGLAYNDPKHGDFPWTSARMNNHLHPMLDQRWVVQCFERQGFLEGLRQLLAKVGDSRVEEFARQAARFILFEDERSYAKRISEVLLKQVSKSREE